MTDISVSERMWKLGENLSTDPEKTAEARRGLNALHAPGIGTETQLQQIKLLADKLGMTNEDRHAQTIKHNLAIIVIAAEDFLARQTLAQAMGLSELSVKCKLLWHRGGDQWVVQKLQNSAQAA